MSSRLSADFSRRFVQYWEFAEREAAQNPQLPKPLVGLQRYWPDWWDLGLAPSERQELQRLTDALAQDKTAQESFLSWANTWTDARLDQQGLGRLVLSQLAQVSPFRTWQSLDSFRLGANALIMQQPKGRWSVDVDVVPLIVIAVRKKREEDLSYYPVNLNVEEKAALRWARNATLSALQGVVLRVLLLVWHFIGRKNPYDRIRKLLRIGSVFAGVGWGCLAGLLILLPTTDLFTYFPDDQLLIPVLWTLVLVPLLGFAYVLITNVREARRMWVQGRALAERLKESQLYLLAGNREKKPRLTVKGTSFGPMLALRNLLALYEAASPSERVSWLWQHFFEELVQRLPRLSGTGEITSLGLYRRVERLGDKEAVSRAHATITEMIVPAQKESLRLRGWRPQPSMTPAEGEGYAAGVGAPRRTSRLWRHPRRSKSEEPTSAIGALRLHRCCHLAQAMLTIGNLVSGRSVVGFVLMCVLAWFTFWVALPDVWSFSNASPPELVGYSVLIPDPQFRPDERFLLLSFQTDGPEKFETDDDALRDRRGSRGKPVEFEVYDYVHHRTVKLKPRPNDPEHVVALIELGSQQLASVPQAIELRHHRRLLGISLPDKIVLARTIP